MGNSSSLDYAARNKINFADWTTIEANEHFKLVKDKNNVYAQEYDLSSDTKLKTGAQLEIYDFRRIQNEPVVKVYGAIFMESSSSTCCGKQNSRKVLTERIPQRLSTIGPLTQSEAFYALNQSLRGYREIYKRLGASSVTSNMIGINQQGFVKVWINDVWAENHPPSIISANKALDDLHGSQTESRMVSNIFNVIEASVEGGHFPQNFRQRISAQQTWTFDSAMAFLNSYVTQNSIVYAQNIKLNRTVSLQNSVTNVFVPPRTSVTNVNTSIKFNYVSSGTGTIGATSTYNRPLSRF